MKTLLLLTALTLLTSCGRVQREVAGITGEPYEICYQGVAYVQFTSGATVVYQPNGQVKTCSEK